MALPSRISGPQIILIRDILSNAFSLGELDDFLLGQFDLKRTRITLRDALDAITRDVVIYFNNRSLIPEFLHNLRVVRPSDIDLLKIIEDLDGNPKFPVNRPSPIQLERKIKAANSMLDVRGWTEHLAILQNQVCRVEVQIPDKSKGFFGTGFLIGPDVVITNYHVVEPVFNGIVQPTNINLRFDYVLLNDGLTSNPGTVYRLAKEWLIDYSPYSCYDAQLQTEIEPKSDELDYVLLRIAEAPGKDKVGGMCNRMTSYLPRGWINPFAASQQFTPQSALYILQHPEGSEMKLALDTEGIIGLNNNRTRLRYRTNTEAGASGAPCFDANWVLLAIHHSSDPNFEPLHKPQYNQGIPFVRILELLDRRNKLDMLTT